MNKQRVHSESAWRQALGVLAGGVNSPVRAFNSVGGTPVFIERAQGSRLYDIDGNEYIDYVGSWGPALLGHTDEAIVESVCRQARAGLSYGAPTQLETEMALAVREFFPSMERIRFVSSGTEACMSAIRLARAYTGRKLIVSFAGCYHGHADSFLGNAGSGLLTLAITEAAGVVPELSRHTLSLDYNDTQGVRQVFEQRGQEIAAVIVEPIAANMNLVLPEASFLECIIDECRTHNALTIFDEVISGFRVHPGGAQGLYQLQPDLTILGKIVGGGMPVGAYGGREDIMNQLAPTGKVYQAGTLSGNPLAMRAGLETLRRLKDPQIYQRIGEQSHRLVASMKESAQRHGTTLSGHALGGLFGLHFLPEPARDLKAISQQGHQQTYRELFNLMLSNGIYLAPSPFEAGFVSLAHSKDDIDQTLAAFDLACQTIKA